MCIKNSVLPQANIYSSKILFDKFEDRNQKRIAQIIKRKNILLSKKKNLNKLTKDISSEQMITPSTQEISTTTNNTNNNILDHSKSSIKEENNNIKISLTSKPIIIQRFLSSFKYKNRDINSLNILEEDLSEKEVNISNLNDTDTDNFIDNYKDKEEITYNNNKIFYEKNKNNENNIKEKNNIFQRNKYAIEYLSSNVDSFVEFKNKLVTKAKYNKNYFTLSYSQALFLDYNNSNNKFKGKEKAYNYEVNDIIKEENESYSPKQIKKLYLRQATNMVSIKKKNIKHPIKLITNKIPNKSFCKTDVNYIDNNKNLTKNYYFKKNALINNCKLKIPKTKLSIEIRNRRKKCENKISKNIIYVKNKKIVVSPKYIKIKSFLENINNKEYKENSNKKKSKKIKQK